MAGQLKIGGNVIATHAGTEGSGTVTLDSSTLTIGSNTTIQGAMNAGSLTSGVTFPAGHILQVVSNSTTGRSQTTVQTWSQRWSKNVKITPKEETSNCFLIATFQTVSSSGAGFYDFSKDSSDVTATYNLSGVTYGLGNANTDLDTIAITFIDERSENTTSEITYSVGYRSGSGGTINVGDSNTNSMNTITVMEIAT